MILLTISIIGAIALILYLVLETQKSKETPLVSEIEDKIEQTIKSVENKVEAVETEFIKKVNTAVEELKTEVETVKKTAKKVIKNK